MPHVNDKKQFQESVELLGGGPIHLHYLARVNGRRLLDPEDSGQQAFQALLFKCFNMEVRRHPFDGSPGRSFTTLRDSYISSVQLQINPLRLVMDASDAARTVSYLLPHSRLFSDSSCEYAGISGLRVEGFRKNAIKLIHVPTGGRLEIAERYYRNIRSALGMEGQDRAPGSPGTSNIGEYCPIWKLNTLHASEIQAEKFWRNELDTTILSGLMSRANALWPKADGLRLLSPRRTSSHLRLKWSGHFTNDDMIELLTQSPIRFHKEYSEIDANDEDMRILKIGAVQMELEGGTYRRSIRR